MRATRATLLSYLPTSYTPHLIHSPPRTLPTSYTLHLIHSPPRTLPTSYTPHLVHSPPRTLPTSYTPHLVHSPPHTLPTSYAPHLVHSPLSMRWGVYEVGSVRGGVAVGAAVWKDTLPSKCQRTRCHISRNYTRMVQRLPEPL